VAAYIERGVEGGGVEFAYKASPHSSLTFRESLLSMDLHLMKTSILGPP
jgi:hypothetical protein